MKINKIPETVSIIGLGPMGQVMAKVFLEKEYQVTVWNRTTSKADSLLAQGAARAETVQEVLAASQLVILSLTDYEAMYQILKPATEALKGRVLVNLSSDTPEKARKAAQWAIGQGADFLAGGVMVPPPLVGKPEAYVLYSGNQAVFDTYQPTLEILGKTDYRGSDPGLALLFYQALQNIMFTSAAGILHAIALIRSANISATAFKPYLNDFLAFLPELLEGTSEEVDQGQYNGEMNNMHMMSAGMAHVAHASRDAHINTTLPNAILEIFNKTVAKGHGKDGLTSIIEVLGEPSI